MSKKSRQSTDSRESMDIVSNAILAIFETPEILNLIETEQSLTVEVSRPLITPFSETDLTSDVLREADCLIDLTDKSNISQKLQTVEQVKSSTYRKEILNGIQRKTDSNNGFESCFEERCYLITDSRTVIWVVTVRNRCSSDLIPIIIDYDQNLEIEENIYANGVREIRSSTDGDRESRYDIFQELDSAVVMSGSFDDILAEAEKVCNHIEARISGCF
jgi:hypothetical protein